MIVAALQEETKKLPRVILHTGVGKINAAASLTEAILKDKPDIIINYGTAGRSSDRVEVGGLYRVDQIIQRDMDASPLGFAKFQTPFGMKKIVLTTNKTNPVVCATGDSFWTGGDEGSHDVVDMEAYALAKVCYHYDIPFISFKYITDGADEQAHEDWEKNLADGIQEFQEKVLSQITT